MDTATQTDYYALRGEIVSVEREIATLAKHLKIWGQYGANKHPKTGSEKALLESAAKYLNELKASGGGITPKKWTADKNHLSAQKTAVQVSPYGSYCFPNKSLCLPVRAKDRTRTSSSTR